MRSTARRLDPILADDPAFRGTIVKRTVKDLVGDKLAGLIASGILSVGDALPGERDLAGALNVSRDTVRRAIENLAARGILETSHGARTRVVRDDVDPAPNGFASARAIDGYTLDDVHAARLFAEREVVADAARHIDDATLKVLAASIATQREAVHDAVRFLIADREFHFAIYRAGRNRLLADFTCDLYAYMMQHRRIAVARPGAIAASIADHAVIAAALRSRDPEVAATAFARHTERIYETTRQEIGSQPET